MKRKKTVESEAETRAVRPDESGSGSDAKRVARGSRSKPKEDADTETPAKGATKKRRGAVRVDRRYATVAVRDLLASKGLWDADKGEWTEAAASLHEKGSLVSDRLDEETREELRALQAAETAACRTEQKAAPVKRVFRLTDTERSQIVGEMINSLRGKIGAKGRSVTAEMIKLLQLERELAPPPPPAASKPKRVTVVFVPPKDLDKYVMRKDAPVAETVEEQE